MKKCEKCGGTFDNEWKYQRHISRKTSCEPIIEIEGDYEETMCKSCGHDFSNIYNLRRHLQSCVIHNDLKLQVKLQLEKEWKKKIREMEEENKRLKLEILELTPIDASVNVEGDHNNLTVNNNIHNGDIICFDRYAIREMLDIILSEKNGNKAKARSIKEKLRTHLSNGDIEGLFSYMLNLIHNNDDFPQGKNIFKSRSGPYKDSYITMGKNGWYESEQDEVLEFYKAEAVKIVGLLSWEPDTPKSQEFIDKFNNGDLDHKAQKVVDKTISKFDLSKKNPKVKIVERPDSDDSDTSESDTSERDIDDDPPKKKNGKEKVQPKSKN